MQTKLNRCVSINLKGETYWVQLEQELDGLTFRPHEVVVHGVVNLAGLVTERDSADVNGLPVINFIQNDARKQGILTEWMIGSVLLTSLH